MFTSRPLASSNSALVKHIHSTDPASIRAHRQALRCLLSLHSRTMAFHIATSPHRDIPRDCQFDQSKFRRTFIKRPSPTVLNEDETECSICLDRIVVPVRLPCPGRHSFCRVSYMYLTVLSASRADLFFAGLHFEMADRIFGIDMSHMP